jgi:hypothetical protein
MMNGKGKNLKNTSSFHVKSVYRRVKALPVPPEQSFVPFGFAV